MQIRVVVCAATKKPNTNANALCSQLLDVHLLLNSKAEKPRSVFAAIPFIAKLKSNTKANQRWKILPEINFRSSNWFETKRHDIFGTCGGERKVEVSGYLNAKGWISVFSWD
ncbi:hypothetical protein Zmor_020571 [Zophobas morio]|uniref:Uncharacterized protein n=1 Tax=Zophobas morio TaxID=2755281 RepID=A0AA38I476_9CUCU|nr:hypothetical protein Zmor_020571 [Zophobas morio]